jgi:hypothetical protein
VRQAVQNRCEAGFEDFMREYVSAQIVEAGRVRSAMLADAEFIASLEGAACPWKVRAIFFSRYPRATHPRFRRGI